MKATPRHNPRSSKNKSLSPLPRGKENHPTQRKDREKEKSMRMCIELATHHQKEAEELRAKNQVLEQRLREQVEDMRRLRQQLEGIKGDLQRNQASGKELHALREENAQLRAGQAIEDDPQSSQASFTPNPLTHARHSRRQKYAQDYESISFVASARQQQGRQARERYGAELRQLQGQVSELQRIEVMVGVMEQQLSDKNLCIDYLRGELERFEDSARGALRTVGLLEERQAELALENGRLREAALKQSYSRTVS